jgi:hypothetical protein
LCSCTEWASATSESLILFKCWFYFIFYPFFWSVQAHSTFTLKAVRSPWK